jgi:hypothetical protein
MNQDQVAAMLKQLTDAVAFLSTNQTSALSSSVTANAETSANLFDRILGRLETFEIQRLAKRSLDGLSAMTTS